MTLHRLRNTLVGCIEQQIGTQEVQELTVDPEARHAYYDRIALSMLLKSEANAPTRQLTPVKKQTRYWTPSLVMMAAAW